MSQSARRSDMQISGLHLLLTYKCNLECDHCFVWGSPWQSGTMTIQTVHHILTEAEALGTIKSIYFEGGEPFLYYPIMLQGVRLAVEMGFQTGIVSNSYWATDLEDAVEWLQPLAGLIHGCSISSDLYHWSEELSRQARIAMAAAEQLGIPMGVISIAQPVDAEAGPSAGQLQEGKSAVMHRGRAAEKLADKTDPCPWDALVECPYEDLRAPGRVHVDPLGEIHICQGISLGNMLHGSLRDICQSYEADSHPVVGPLLADGPAELVRRYGLSHREGYADACHLCYEARSTLRERFPNILGPDQMYGVAMGDTGVTT
jgi:hypothetical protein